MFVDLSNQEYVCRIVYFGPGLSGKSSNITALKRFLDNARVETPEHIDNEGERILRCQLRPHDQPRRAGLAGRIEVVTNPGRSYYNANRRDLLNGADGIVFVADSRREAIDENIDAMNDLWSFLNHHRIGPDIPLVIQFNKQDLDSAIPFDQLNPLLNSQQKPSFSAVAEQGSGVTETFLAVLELVRARVDDDAVRREIDRAQGKGGSSEPKLPVISEPEPPAVQAESWLLTCCRCDSVLEVPQARSGDLFTCGSCHAVLEVVDPDTGETREGTMPAAPPPPRPQTPPAGAHDEYMSLPESSGVQSALQSRNGSQPAQPPPQTNNFTWQDPHSQSIIREITGTQATIGSSQVDLQPRIPGYDFAEQLDSSLLGTRYSGIDRERNRPVRGLVLNPMLLRQPGYDQQFEPHVRMAGQVRHPNLVPVSAVRWWNDIPVIISFSTPEYEPLSLILARRRTLAPPQAMGIIRQLALALEESARHGVVHGWIRPDVVLINPTGSVLLDDLAVPKNPGFLVRESMGGSASTEYYLAPEQLHGEAAPDIRTDIFLLGALLFRMVTGEGLITGYNAHEALHKASTNGPRRMREVNPEISRDLDSFFLRLVAIEKKDRVQKHQELVNTLEKFGGGAKRNTMRAGRHPNTARVTRRRAGSGSGSAAGHPRRSLAGTTSYTEEDMPRRRKQGSNTLVIAILLVLLGITILAFVFREQIDFGTSAFDIPDRQRSGATRAEQATPDAERPTRPEHASGDRDEPLSADPVTRARQMLGRYERSPDQALEQQLTRVIAELRQQQTTRAEGTRLYYAFNEARERHNNTQPDGDGTRQTTTPAPDGEQPALTEDREQPSEGDPPPADQAVGEEPVPARVKLAITEHITKEQFSQAMTLAEAEITDPAQLQHYRELIEERHQAARNSIARLVRAETDLARVAEHLEPALQDWGMTGDAAWAASLLSEARERITNEAAEQDGPPPLQHDRPLAQANAIDTIDGLPVRAIVADAAIDRALVTLDIKTAEQALIGLDPESGEYEALRKKIDLFAAGPAVMGAAFDERSPKARIKTPFGSQRWDVAAISAEGIKAISPKDEQAHLDWSQLDLADIGRLYDKIAASRPPEADPREDAIACITLLVGDNAGLASIAASRARKARYGDYSALNLVLEFERRQPAALLVAAAERALAGGDALALADSLATLQQNEKLAFAERQAAIERYLAKTDPELLADLGDRRQAGDARSGGDMVRNRDQLDFTDDSDLLAFPIRDGGWRIDDDTLRSGRGTCSLLRNDMQSVMALSMEFATASTSGQLQVTFRGTTFTFDFAKKGFSASNAGGKTAFVAFPVIPELPYKIDFLIADGTMAIEVNSTESIQLNTGSLDDRLRIATIGAKDLGINHLSLQRQAEVNQEAPRSAGAELMEQALGWTPIGAVELKAPRIILSPIRVGRSAIIRALQPKTIGMQFEMQGDGKLFVVLGQRRGERYETAIDLPANDRSLKVTLRWTGNRLTIITQAEDAVEADPPTIFDTGMIPRSHLILEAERSVTFLRPPSPIKADQ